MKNKSICLKISLNTLYICPIGSLEKTLDLFKEAGYKCFDLSLSWFVEQCDILIDKDDYLDRAIKLREYADSIGMRCNQCHSFMRFKSVNYSNDDNDYYFELEKRCIRIAGIMGADNIVVHPFSTYSEEENVRLFLELSNIAEESGINIAIENMPTGLYSDPNGICSLLGKINRKNVGLCLDIGHAELPKESTTCAVEIIKRCHMYLKCLHIDDNDLKEDSHLMPGDGLINFKDIFRALKDINYNGFFTFEIDGYLYPLPLNERIEKLPSLFKECVSLIEDNF